MAARRLGHVVLNVASLQRSVPFYVGVIGLREVGQLRSTVFFSFGDNHHDLALREVGSRERAPGDGIGLRHLAFRIGEHVGAPEFITDVNAVLDPCCKAHCRPALAELVPMFNDVADERGLVHTLGKLRLDVVAPLGPDTFQVGLGWREHLGGNEELLLDQRGDLRALDKALEDVAEAPPITPARCRG